MRRRVSRRVALPLALLGLMVVLGSATSRADEVDIAVEAFAAGGTLVGVSIGANEKQLVKSLVRCTVTQKKPILDCSRDELIRRLPQEAQPLARCLLVSRQNIQECAKAEIISRLPPETRRLAECIATEGDLGLCSKRIATDQLSRAQQVALNEALTTIDRLKADAASRLGESGTIRNIIRVAEGIRDDDWDKVLLYGGAEVYKTALKTALRTVLPVPVATLADPAVDALVQNRADLYAGIIDAAKKGDEGKVAALGVEVYVYSSVPILPALCGLIPRGDVKEATCGNVAKGISAVGGAVGDAAEAVSDGATDGYNSVQDLLTGRREGCGTREEFYGWHFSSCRHHALLAKQIDPGRYAEIEQTLYMRCRHNMHPCAKKLVGSTSDRISDICNPIRDRFRTEVDDLYGRLKSAAAAYASGYQAPDLTVERPEDCESRSSQKFFMDCVDALQGQFPERMEAPKCTLDGKRSLGHAFTISGVCGNAAFVGEDSNLRLSFRPNCRVPIFQETSGPVPSNVLAAPPLEVRPHASEAVAERAPTRCSGGMILTTTGRCACPPGSAWSGRRCVRTSLSSPSIPNGGSDNVRQFQTKPVPLPVPSPTGSGGFDTSQSSENKGRHCPRGLYWQGGRCACPAGKEFKGGYCRDIPQNIVACGRGMILVNGHCERPRPAAQPCPRGSTGTRPNCQCPRGQQWSGARCIPLPRPPQACTGGRVGTPPNCSCPPGTRLMARYRRCIRVSTAPTPNPKPPNVARECRPGTIGRWPRCHRPRPQQPVKCPAGSIGAWPKCGSVVR